MACMRVRDILVGEKRLPIEIRVLRRWISKGKKEELCYQFVDAYGDAIEATAELNDKNYFDSIIQLHSCYKVSGYMCDSPRYMATVEHSASLVIGQRAKFQPIKDSTIPTVYFNFANYEKLKERINDKSLLTDHIGRVEKNSLRTISTGITLRKILLQDERSQEVEITFWPEMQHLIGDEVVLGDVIAITSTTVSEHNGLLQLESTYLTTTIINPELPQTSAHVNRLKLLPPMQPSKAKEKMVPVSDLSPDLSKCQGYTYFKCYATINEIQTHRLWYSAKCSKCSNRLFRHKEDGKVKYECKDHEEIIPNFRYCVHATITDGTATTPVVLFNEGMQALINISCKDLVTKHGNQDPKILPNEISCIVGISKVLHLSISNNDGMIVVQDVSDVSDPDPAQNTQPTTPGLSPATPNPKVTAGKKPSTGTPASTPNPKLTAAKRLSTETPGVTEQPKLKKA